MRLFELIDDRHHGRRLGLVAFEGRHREWVPGGIGQQPKVDLRFQAALLGKSRLAKPVTGIGLKVQCAHVVEHQAGRP
jgi:hypothetical protein